MTSGDDAMKMKSYPFYRLSILLLVTMLFSAILLPAASAESAEQVTEVRKLLEQYHLSGPTDDQLQQKTIKEMIDSLKDPYTQYFDDEQWKSFSNLLEQTFVGIGIVM